MPPPRAQAILTAPGGTVLELTWYAFETFTGPVPMHHRSFRRLAQVACWLVLAPLPALAQPRLLVDLATGPRTFEWKGDAWQVEGGLLVAAETFPSAAVLWWVPEGAPEEARIVLDGLSRPRWDGRRLLVSGRRPGAFREPDLWSFRGPEPERVVPTSSGVVPVVYRGHNDSGPAEGFLYIGKAVAIGDYRVGLWRYDAGTDRFALLAETGWPFGPGVAEPCDEIAPIADRVVFCGCDALWVSDGTAEGTFPLTGQEGGGIATGRPLALRGLGNGRALFTASDGDPLYPLWVSDGTQAGTHPLGGLSGSPHGFVVGDSRLAWEGICPATGCQWTADLELASPVSVPNHGEIFAVGDFGLLVRRVPYFGALPPPETGDEPWVWHPDSGWRLLADLAPGPASPDVWGFVNHHDQISFIATTPALGTEAWTSDGTTEGTRVITDLAPGPENGVDPHVPLALLDGGDLVVARRDAGSGLATPWRLSVDGATVEPVADLTYGTAGSNPAILDAFGAHLLFWAFRDSGRELWASDGTPEGTFHVRGAELLAACPGPWPLVRVDRSDLLVGCDGGVYEVSPDASLIERGRFAVSRSNRRSPLAPDGSAKDIFGGAQSSSRTRFIRLGSRILGWLGEKTYTVQVLDLATRVETTLVESTRSNHPAFVALDEDEVLFRWNDGSSHGAEVWISDGTPAGTRPLGNELVLGPAGGVEPWFAVGGRAMLVEPFGTRSWLTDGTPSGTDELLDVTWSSLVRVGQEGACFFGTLAGKRGLIRLAAGSEAPGLIASLPDGHVAATYHDVDQTAFLFDPSGHEGVDVYTTDCTGPGTHQVTTLAAPHWQIGSGVVAQGSLWLGRNLVWSGFALDRMELASGRTERLLALPLPIASQAGIGPGAAHNGLLFFRAAEAEHGSELWVVELDLLFGDGFESGDLSAWAGSAP